MIVFRFFCRSAILFRSWVNLFIEYTKMVCQERIFCVWINKSITCSSSVQYQTYMYSHLFTIPHKKINILDFLLFYCEECSLNTAYYTKPYLHSMHYFFFTLILIENNARKKLYTYTLVLEKTQRQYYSKKQKAALCIPLHVVFRRPNCFISRFFTAFFFLIAETETWIVLETSCP